MFPTGVDSTLSPQLPKENFPVINNIQEVEKFIVLLSSSIIRNKTIGIGVSLYLDEIRCDLHIICSCTNPDITFLHGGHERKTFSSRNRVRFGQIRVSNFNSKSFISFYMFELETFDFQ